MNQCHTWLFLHAQQHSWNIALSFWSYMWGLLFTSPECIMPSDFKIESFNFLIPNHHQFSGNRFHFNFTPNARSLGAHNIFCLIAPRLTKTKQHLRSTLSAIWMMVLLLPLWLALTDKLRAVGRHCLEPKAPGLMRSPALHYRIIEKYTAWSFTAPVPKSSQCCCLSIM